MKIFFAVLVFLSFTVIISCNNSIKPINSELKIPENTLAPCPESPNCFRTTQALKAAPETVQQAFLKSLSLNNAEKIEEVNISDKKLINAVFKIPIFGWLDDVVIHVDSNSSNADITFVHIKSSSREGYYDLGVNKRRVNKILKHARKEINKP
jgi:uncharacterized protein (DUF1499 family)